MRLIVVADMHALNINVYLSNRHPQRLFYLKANLNAIATQLYVDGVIWITSNIAGNAIRKYYETPCQSHHNFSALSDVH